MKIPRGENAIVDIEKLRDYCLGQTISIEAFPMDQLLTLHYATSEQVA